MSHPYTVEYMLKGETTSTQIERDVKRRKENLKAAHRSQIESEHSTKVSESELVNDGCPTDEVEENEETPDNDMTKIKEVMGIDIADGERLSFIKILRMAMRRRMEIFADDVSIVGLTYLFKPSDHKIGSIIRKIVWSMLLLFGTGFMVFQIYDRITFYQTYPTKVNYQVAYNRSLRFPTVSICSQISASKKALLRFGPQAKELTEHTYPPLYGMFEFGNASAQFDFSSITMDWEFFYSFVGQKMKDSILECSFGNQPCYTDAFTAMTADGPQCISINPIGTNYITTQPAASNGFRLVLWANQSDAALILTAGVGFRVYMHDPRDTPIVGEVGFAVGTGISASVSISLRNLSMLPSPYGECSDAKNYTYMKCTAQCLGKYMIATCGCRPFMVYAPGEQVCPLGDLSCVTSAPISWVTSGAGSNCGCPLQCYLPTYPYTVSTSPLSEHFLMYMSQKPQFKGRNLTMSKLSKELVYLDIFYADLNYVDIQTIPAYKFLTLVCDIGGAFGLILGGTLLTVAELSQLFIQLCHELFTSVRFAQMQRR